MKKMIKPLLAILLFSLFTGCTVQSSLVRWDAPLIRSSPSSEPVTYWDDGNQYYLISTDHLDVSLTGFVNSRYLVILFSMKNRSDEIIHFYPALCSMNQEHHGKDQRMFPVRPSALDAKTRNFITATSALNVLNVALVGDRKLSSDIEYAQQAAVFQNADDKAELAKNHTLFPDSWYSGCLFFAKSTTGTLAGAINVGKVFNVNFSCGGEEFSVTGRIPADKNYDGTELPEMLEKIVFGPANENSGL